MIFHSIVPLDIVFGNPDASGAVNYSEAEYMGEKVLVSRLVNNDYVIARLLSTRPAAYLDTKLQPGAVVKSGDLKIKS